MKIPRQIALVAAIFYLGACDQATPLEPSGISLTPSLDAVTGEQGAVVVRGTVTTPSGAGSRILEVDALQTPSGNVHGSYRITITATGSFLAVTVSCVGVAGNTAWVAGHITESNIPTVQIGSVSYFYVTDNGKPHPQHSIAADAVSIARINDQLGQDAVFCSDHPTVLPLLTGLTGDIDIR